MQKIVLILLAILLSMELHSQQLSVGFQIGTGSYSMNELKSLNDYTIKNLPFDTKTVANFPPYINYGASLLIKNGKVSTGLIYTFISTGSRVSGKDYSGEYSFDMLIKSNTPGIYGSFDLQQDGELLFSFYTAVGFMFSNLETKELMRVQGNTLINESFKFSSSNLYAEPGLKVVFPVSFLEIGLNAGYAFQFSTKMFSSKEDEELYLVNPDTGDQVQPGWNGFRAGLSVFYTF